MNFLAHLYLSGENNDMIIGNFIADHVKGSSMGLYREGIRAGIILHRAIDFYTDTHPVVRQAVQRLRPDYHKYAGVIVDMYFDHFLAALWNDWSAEPLKQFTARMYAILNDSFQILPPRTRHMLPHMVEFDWLFNYGNFKGLNLALSGMARRTTFLSNMETAAEKLSSDYAFYEESFRKFFPDLVAYVDEVRDDMTAVGLINRPA